jgi:putative transposase
MVITRQHIHKIALRGAMTGSNPVDRSKLGTKRHILTDKKGIPISAVITSANTHDIKAVTDVMDNAVVRQQQPTPSDLSTKTKTIKQHLCLGRAYNSKAVEQEIIKRGYVPHTPYKRKRGEEEKKDKDKAFQKRHRPRRRWVVERTNSWHNRFRKLFTRYEKKAENHLGEYSYPVASSSTER